MPVEMSLSVTGVDAFKAQLAKLQGQWPFAMSLALNQQANAMQKAIQATLPGSFTLRRAEFIRRTVYRRPGTYPQGDFANKTSLTAALRINPDRDVLRKHEEDRQKVARNGGRLAIPLIRIGQPNTVIGQGSKYALKNMPVVPGASAMSITRPKRGAGTTFYATQTRKAGATVIWEAKGARTRPQGIWLLVRGGVKLTPRLGFHETAGRTFEREWATLFGRALDRALASAR